MLTVEIRVNGSIVSAISAINTGASTGLGKYRYEYQSASFPMNNNGPCKISNGFVDHKRLDGIEALVSKLCAVVDKSVKP